MKNMVQRIGTAKRAVVTGAITLGGAGLAMADGSGNAGADAIVSQISGLVPVAIAVVGAAVLVIVVPWGAKLAISAWHAIRGK